MLNMVVHKVTIRLYRVNRIKFYCVYVPSSELNREKQMQKFC